tara:strand:+ start:331 stop:549 length:219 start_codon:yes stop_codon:yes gene_type:complete
MDAEKITNIDANNLSSLVTPKSSEKVSSSARVDINILLNRARKVQEKETRTNFIFLGLIICLIAIVGLILSF